MISREMQKTLAIGIAIFLLMLFWGGRWMYGSSLANLLKYREQRQRVVLENRVGDKLNELKKLRSSMTTIKESSYFLAEIAKMVGKLNIKLISISAQPVEKSEESVTLGVNLDIDTTYHELGVFISHIDNSEVFIMVKKMEIEPIGTTLKTTTRVNAKLLLSTFYLTDTFLEK